METVEFNDGGLGITVYVDGCKGSASTADLSKPALTLAVEKAIQIAKYTGQDPCSGLAEADLMIREEFDLDLYHPVIYTDEGLQFALKQKPLPLKRMSVSNLMEPVTTPILALKYTATHMA